MSAPRKVLEGLRAAGVVMGDPAILLIAGVTSVRATLHSLWRGRLPSLSAALGTLAVALYAGPVRRWMRVRCTRPITLA